MKYNFKIDLLLLSPVIVLILIGLTTLASIDIAYFRSQLFSAGAALLIFIFFAQFDFQSLLRLKIVFYGAAAVLLTIVLILGIESRGAVRWIEILGIRIQLSEVFKPLLSLSFAAQIGFDENPTFKSLFKSVLILIPIAVLIYLQPDLGNALIYAGVFLMTLIIMGFRLRWFAILIAPALAALPYLWTLLHDYQRQRILSFLSPHQDPLGTSYNSIQALIAVGSGALWGRGLGESTQSGLLFLPERQTDFIFATLSEGMGFVGAMIVIAAFAMLLWRIYQIFSMSSKATEKVFLSAAFFFFFVQFLLNIGMNLGILPVVGVTLPFVSYGGSSLVASFIFLGIISSISFSLKRRNVLEI